ncbi:MAG: bile acid:sodium symporter family protein [Myxococcota bacterium]|nr:bile acid:sodium symporter family protein [Myxococcota bacterium]
MQSTVLLAVFLPLGLGVVMLGLGLSLTLADFTRVAKYPRAVVVALVCQMLLLPAFCLAVVKGFGLPPVLAAGMMLLAASPGGATANLYSHLAGGDVALNLTLTAVNSLLSVFTLPLIVNLSMTYLLGDQTAIPLQFGKTLQIFAVVLGPVSIGMVLRKKVPALARRLDRPVKGLSALFLVMIVIATAIGERHNLVRYFTEVGLAALVFNLVSLAVGYWVPRLVRLGRPQAVAIGMEIGIHNGTLAIAIASGPSLLNNTAMSIPPAVYSVIMFLTAAAFGYWVSRGEARPAPAVAPAP